MRALTASLIALGVWAMAILPATAAWDNVFQPTLFCHKKKPVTSQYAPAVGVRAPVVAATPVCDTCGAAPQPSCSTSYTQRCYYQPVTTYQTKTYYEPVTTYRTSYYYEPVCSYRYSCYYDPCTCSYQQVAVPTTSYQLRAQNCPVQSWTQRCVQEPVTSYQKACYWQPQTTCCTTTSGTPIHAGQAPMVNAISTPQQPPQVNAITTPQPPPQVNSTITPPQPPQVNTYSVPQTPQPGEQPPSISGTRTPSNGSQKSTLWDQYYPPLERAPEIRGSTPGTSWQPQLGAPVPVQTKVPAPPLPPVKLDRIAVGPNSQVDGKVVRQDNSPRPNAKVLFINAGTGQRQTVFANTAGRFQVELPSGSWHVYLHGADDLPIHDSRIDVNGAQPRQVTLVSRAN